MKRADIEEVLRHEDVAALITLLNGGYEIDELRYKNLNDVLLISIMNKNDILFDRTMESDFNLEKSGFLYLHHAVRSNKIRFCTELLKKPLCMDAINKVENIGKFNTLHVACHAEIKPEIIIMLSQHGGNWNHKNSDGQTPLHFLLRNVEVISKEIVQEIISKADFTINDSIGISPLDIARSYKHDSLWMGEESHQYLVNQLEEKYGK